MSLSRYYGANVTIKGRSIIFRCWLLFSVMEHLNFNLFFGKLEEKMSLNALWRHDYGEPLAKNVWYSTFNSYELFCVFCSSYILINEEKVGKQANSFVILLKYKQLLLFCHTIKQKTFHHNKCQQAYIIHTHSLSMRLMTQAQYLPGYCSPSVYAGCYKVQYLQNGRTFGTSQCDKDRVIFSHRAWSIARAGVGWTGTSLPVE